MAILATYVITFGNTLVAGCMARLEHAFMWCIMEHRDSAVYISMAAATEVPRGIPARDTNCP